MWSSESNKSLAICRAKVSFFSYFKILRVDPVPQGQILGVGAGGAHPPPHLRDDPWLSNTTGILPKKTLWFIGVEVKHDINVKCKCHAFFGLS